MQYPMVFNEKTIEIFKLKWINREINLNPLLIGKP